MIQFAILKSNKPEFENDFIYASIAWAKNAHLFGGKDSDEELPKEAAVTRISNNEFFDEHIQMQELILLGYSDLHIDGSGLEDNMNDETADYIKYVNG